MTENKQHFSQAKFFPSNISILLFTLVLPVFIVSLILVDMLYRHTETEIEDRLKKSVEVSSDSLSRLLNDANTICRFSDNSLVVLNRIVMGKGIEYADSQYLKQYNAFLESFINSGNGIESIYLYIDNGDGLVYTSSNGLIQANHLLDNDWVSFTSLNTANSLMIREVTDYSFEKPHKVLTYIHKPSGYNSVLIINFKLDVILNTIDSIIYYEKQNIIFETDNGEFLFATPRLEDIEQTELSKYETVIISNNNYNYRCKSIIPKSIVITLIFRQNTIAFAILLILLVFSIVLSFFLSSRSAKQLNYINNLFDLAIDDVPIDNIKTDGSDPFSLLLQNVFHVFMEKEQLKNQLKERKYKQQVAELKALQYQINPHFLYNALQTVSYKILEQTNGDRNEANIMIEDISDLIRFSLGKSGSYVCLTDEIDNCIKYLHIQQIRYQNWFKVEWDVDQNLMNYEILRLILQPIIENAVIHGLRNKKEKGLLKIKIKRIEDQIIFYVFDNGKGMNKQTLKEIRRSLSYENINYDSQHIGLENCNSRLIIEYSENSSIKISSRENYFTLVKFRIPYVEN